MTCRTNRNSPGLSAIPWLFDPDFFCIAPVYFPQSSAGSPSGSRPRTHSISARAVAKDLPASVPTSPAPGPTPDSSPCDARVCGSAATPRNGNRLPPGRLPLQNLCPSTQPDPESQFRLAMLSVDIPQSHRPDQLVLRTSRDAERHFPRGILRPGVGRNLRLCLLRGIRVRHGDGRGGDLPSSGRPRDNQRVLRPERTKHQSLSIQFHDHHPIVTRKSSLLNRAASPSLRLSPPWSRCLVVPPPHSLHCHAPRLRVTSATPSTGHGQ